MKDLRIRLTREQDTADFQNAKHRAERELGFTLSDSEFAGRIVRQAIKTNKEQNQ